MSRLPTVGGDDGNWGTVLNDFLSQAHNSDGTIKSTAVNGTTDWINVVNQYGADSTGTNDSTTAIQNALNATPSGGVCYLPAGTYLISSQLTIPATVQLKGNQGYRAIASVSKLKCTASFSGSSLITFATGTPCGSIENVQLDGSSLPSGSVDGIACIGACKQGSIIGVNIGHMTGNGINISSSGGNPDGWYLHQISSHNNGGDGIHWDYSVDGQLDIFHLDNNTGSGLTMGTMNNTSVSNGKCQQNTNYGYALTGGFVKSNASFIACFSENNHLDGWNFNLTGGGQGSIQLIGCSTRDDGTSGTSGSGYAGFNFTLNTKTDLSMVGCSNYITSSASGPDYGLKLTNCGYVTISGGSYIGSVAAYLDGTGNTSVNWSKVIQSVGQDGTRSSISVVTSSAGATPTSFTPSDPAGSNSTTNVMMGLGSTCKFTPINTGRILVNVTGYLQIATSPQTCQVGARYGTGTAPVNAVADTGTRFGSIADPSLRPPSVGGPCALAFTAVLSLTVGTSYWFDLMLNNGASSSNQANIKNVSMSFIEI